MEAYAAAYDPATMLAKFHYLVHSASVLRAFGFTPNAIAHIALERKHKTAKKFGDAVANHNFSTSTIIRESTAQQLHDLQNCEYLNLTPRLLNARAATAEILALINMETPAISCCNFAYSVKARFSAWETCQQNDTC